jgi:hypothetical protein
MKYLDKFIEYIKESKELDLDLVENEYLVPIRHLGVKTTTYKSLLTDGQFAGHNQISIKFDYDNFTRVDINGNISVHCIDKRIWELLDELLMFKNVIDTYGGNSVGIWLGSTQINITIYIKIEEDDKYFIEKLFNELTIGYNKKVHIVSELDEEVRKEVIKVYINGTKRVWDNFIRDNEVDLSKFDEKITKSNGKRWNSDLLIELKLKK